MHDRGVRRVEPAFQGLQPVALLDDLGDVAVAFRDLGPGEFGRRRDLVSGTHIGPDDAAVFAGRIGGEANVLLELMLRRLVELVEAVALDIKFPAVIDAPETALLVAPEEERDAAVRTE